MALRMVFAGTPEFAVPSLRAAAERHEVVAVYTQPDRPAGRGRDVAAVAGEARSSAPRHPGAAARHRCDAALSRDALRALQPDLMVVVAYGLILPQAILDIPRHGGWNVHASLLPRWRGAAPIQRAIEAGDPETGACLMQMEKGLDTGPVLLVQRLPSVRRNGRPVARSPCGARRADLVRWPGPAACRSAAGRRPQAADGATYARKLEKCEALLDWSRPAGELARKVRAFDPWPIAESTFGGARVRIQRRRGRARRRRRAGRHLAPSRDGIDIACGKGALRIGVLQRDGGKAVTAADYLNAHPRLKTA